jgi:hypothetical protein
MNILETILSAQNGAAVRQMGQQVGLGEDQTMSALSALVPALAGGFQRNMQSSGGLESLLGALTGGQHSRYMEDPSNLASATADGNGILGHILGSKDVSRQVATRAATQTGIDPAIIKQMLPLVAAMMMGTMAQGRASAAPPTTAPASGGGQMWIVTPLGGQKRDGRMVYDVLGVVGKRTLKPKA